MDNTRSTDWRHHDVLGGSHPHHFSLEESQDDYMPLPIPSRQTMQERWAFRQGIREETLQHRRIHRHGGMRETGRNIAFVLRDREVRGASAVVLQRRRIREPAAEQSAPGKEDGASPVSINGNASSAPVIDALQDTKAPSRAALSSSPFQPQQSQSVNRVSYPVKISHEARLFAEYCSVVRYHSAFFKHLGGDDEPGERGERPSSSKAVSTISIAFSPDSQTMASTHGDHTVKITCCNSGMLLQTLEGHPRTPWTVKYHPVDSDMLASGCLGHQVRLWNWPDKVCLQMIRLEFAIISLSFHPAGNLLAVANGTRLHFWGYNNSNTNNAGAADQATAVNRNNNSRGILTEVDQRHMLRCVHFPPEGSTIIIGGVNPATDDRRRPNRGGIGGGGMSFYLRLWDFDVDAALQTYDDPGSEGQRRRAISNPRTFVPRALLYNDGGFDVSPDGKVLCACAEYWLPDGVDNAMELLQREEVEDDSDDGMEHSDDDDGNAIGSPGANKTSTEREIAVSTPTLDSRDKEQPKVSTPQASDSQGNVGGGMLRNSVRFAAARTPPHNPSTTSEAPALDYIPQTPPRRNRPRLELSPPSPPGRRFSGGNHGTSRACASTANNAQANTGSRVQPLLPTPTQDQQQSGAGSIALPPPPPPPGITSRPPHPLSVISGAANYEDVMNQKGRYVPHVVTVSLDTTPIADMGGVQRGVTKLTPVARGYRPRLGQLLEASPLDGTKASAVTCVKFSPSTDFCLIGYGVREPVVEGGGQYHPVTALYRVRGGMTHVSTMLSGDDDVNIARFHPDSGYGFVYGTKQGRVRVLSPRPWNFYNC